jgi:hypothetical protein
MNPLSGDCFFLFHMFRPWYGRILFAARKSSVLDLQIPTRSKGNCVNHICKVILTMYNKRIDELNQIRPGTKF